MLPDIGGLADVAKRCLGLATVIIALWFLYGELVKRYKFAGLVITAIFIIVLTLVQNWMVLLGVGGAIGVATIVMGRKG